FLEQTVPPGPFELTEINPPSGVGNLTVTLTEADGSIETFLVPYSMSAGKLNPGSARYSLSAGNFRNAAGVSDTLVMQAYMRYGLNGVVTPGLELLSTNNYQGAGVQMAFNNPWGSLSLNRLHSQGQAQAVGSVYAAGYNHSINYSAPALGPLQAYVGVSEQSMGYVSPLAALTNTSLNPYNPLSIKNSIYLNLGLSLKSWGGLSLGVVEQNAWTDNQQTHQYRLSYSTNFSRVGLSVYLSQTTYANGTPSVDTVGFIASVPLNLFDSAGGLRVSQSQTGTAKPTQSVSAYGSGMQNNALSYNLTHSQTGELGNSSASLNYQHPWGTLGLSLSGADDGSSQQGGISAAGGMVLHGDGVIMSPSLGTTFAIVELPKGEGAGVSGSQARINRSGFGVVPSLSAYYLNDVQISLEGASTEVEVDNPTQKIAPVEGSIVRLKFNATTGRPLLVVLQASNGARIPIGGSVTDAAGNEVGTVGQGSRALVRVQNSTGRLKVQWGDKPDETCLTDYALGEGQSTNASGFTHLKLRCEVGAVGGLVSVK
ncbi:MAG: fimbrial biogenesis outer membrane usher protein, partial [Betaproteobacteria bacterium]|nr:fimbrial biogenesis outer membrane usher protein [Betaproteobacteria bacterium]